MSEQGEGPAAPDLALLKRDYEESGKPLAEIGMPFGIKTYKLSRMARRYGWRLRSLRTTSKAKGASAKDTIARLKVILRARLESLERQIASLGAEADAADNERKIRATNLLVRTLEKVLELERRDGAERARASKQRVIVDDARREELARKLEALHLGRVYPG